VRDTERQSERQRETERDRERQRETERDRERQRGAERERERQREAERDRERTEGRSVCLWTKSEVRTTEPAAPSRRRAVHCLTNHPN
jgi:hypothetical protein